MLSINSKTRLLLVGVPMVLFVLAPIAHAQIGLDFLNLPAGAEIGTILSQFYVFGVSMVVILALIMFTIGGVQYMIAGDRDPGPAKQRMKDALFGLILALISYLILYTINPDLVREVKLNVNIIDLRQTQPADLQAQEGEPCIGGSSKIEEQCVAGAGSCTDRNTCEPPASGAGGNCLKSCALSIPHDARCIPEDITAGKEKCASSEDRCRVKQGPNCIDAPNQTLGNCLKSDCT